MFGPMEKVLSTLKKSEVAKENIQATKKNTYQSIFEAIDKATNSIREGVNPDFSKDDIETQTKKLYEISVKENPEGADDKEGYQYLGSSAQENFYAKANYDANTKKLLNLQVINSVDEEVANITNEMDKPSAMIISNVVDQLRLDSVSFKILLDVGAIDLEPDAITPADGTGEPGAGGPAAPSLGSGPTGAQADGGLGNSSELPGATGATPGGELEDEEEENKFKVGPNESKKSIFVPWAKTIKESPSLFETIDVAKQSRKPIPEGVYRVMEKGDKLSLVAKVLAEGIVSSKYRYLISNEDVNISITSPEGTTTVTSGAGGTTVNVDSQGQEQVAVSTEPVAGAMGGDINQVELPYDSIGDADLSAPAEQPAEGDVAPDDSMGSEDSEVPELEKDDEFEIPEGVNKGFYKVIEVKKDKSGKPTSVVCEKSKFKKAMKAIAKADKAADKKEKDAKKKAKEAVSEGRTIVKIRPENGDGPWISDPQQIKAALLDPNSQEYIVNYIENGQKGVTLLSDIQGVDINVGPEVVKVAILDPDVAAAAAATEPPPITPAEANLPQEQMGAVTAPPVTPPVAPPNPNTPSEPELEPKSAVEAKNADVTKEWGLDLINSLLEKHGIKEAETTPASREDKGGSASISKEGEGNLKMTGGINLDDKGGVPHSKTSSPASKEDDGGTASISKEGEGKLEQGDINRKDDGGGPATAASGAAGASADKGPISNSGAAGDTSGSPQGDATPTSTATLENKKILEYIAKLEKEMNEEKEPVIKESIQENINWLKSKIKK